jgi:hypothetical protein
MTYIYNTPIISWEYSQSRWEKEEFTYLTASHSLLRVSGYPPRLWGKSRATTWVRRHRDVASREKLGRIGVLDSRNLKRNKGFGRGKLDLGFGLSLYGVLQLFGTIWTKEVPQAMSAYKGAVIVEYSHSGHLLPSHLNRWCMEIWRTRLQFVLHPQRVWRCPLQKPAAVEAVLQQGVAGTCG